jgi:tetratricopeptide (TPR) repeat protein
MIALNNYINNPKDDLNNFLLAIEYEKQHHYSPASGFYLRCAELTPDINRRYESLLRMYFCYKNLGQRDFTCETLLKEAISLCPSKPEAYFLLTQFYESKSDWLNVYVYSSIALDTCKEKSKLTIDIDFSDIYALLFQKAAAAWWVGKPDEARKLFRLLLNEYIDDLDPKYKKLLENNLSSLGCGPESVAIRPYTKKLKNRLKFSFDDIDRVEKNFSQVYQDMFILSVLNGKKNGIYLEIGASHPHKNSNTYLLETLFNWSGIGIEYQEDLAKQHKDTRRNPVLCTDALIIDYEKLLSRYFPDTTDIDYLQLDIEPPRNTYEVLLSIPFNKYSFSIITYEHDYYVDITRSYREKSRDYLESIGYELIVPNISPNNNSPFEDWWVHPNLIDRERIKTILSFSDPIINSVEKLFLNN